MGPTPPLTLRSIAGKAVLLVLYALPGSRARMRQLAEREGLLASLGVEVIAVPTDAAPDAIRRLGAEPRALFPVVTDGCRRHRLTPTGSSPTRPRRVPDRPPGVRSRHRAGRGEAATSSRLLAQIQELDGKGHGAGGAEHVH